MRVSSFHRDHAHVRRLGLDGAHGRAWLTYTDARTGAVRDGRTKVLKLLICVPML